MITLELDAKDLQILAILQQQGRLPNQELAKQINLSPSPCLRRVKMLEDAGVIQGYAAQVSAKAVGLGLNALIAVTLVRHDKDTIDVFEAQVRAIPEIMECYLQTGADDYWLRAVLPDLEAYETFMRDKLHTIPGIRSMTSSIVVSTIKSSQMLPLEQIQSKPVRF